MTKSCTDIDTILAEMASQQQVSSILKLALALLSSIHVPNPSNMN